MSDKETMGNRALTSKQRKFIEVYAGNGTEAARLAGYKGTDEVLGAVGYENLKKPQIAAAIAARESKLLAPAVANREARQKFWSETMADVSVEMRDRLKASELLGKSEADFTEKVEHSGKVGIYESLSDDELDARILALAEAKKHDRA